jgi:hypothetical protein
LKLPTAGTEVPEPEGLQLISWYDLTPMRPDELAATNIFRWREAVALRNAYEQGRDQAHREKETTDKLMSMDMQA